MARHRAVGQDDVVAGITADGHGFATREPEASHRAIGIIEESQGDLATGSAKQQSVPPYHDHHPPEEDEEYGRDHESGSQQEPVIRDWEGDIGDHFGSPET
ncbi:MAG TPA: hypothetical protein VEQ36_05565 [Thermomicrobiales bacterium]|nr:hypothetical protein [Thermomicrobiales bacterium]